MLEGVLHCSNPECRREYPIIDGIPLIIANLRQYVADNLPAIQARRDLSDVVESILGDCCGSNSAYDRIRQHLSSYVWDHYGELDPAEAVTEPRPGSILRTLQGGLELVGQSKSAARRRDARHKTPASPAEAQPAPTPAIDVGCAVGRTTFELAMRAPGLVLGVDLHFPMLRLAAEVLRYGTIRYPRRRVGLVYERREFPVSFPHTDNLDFWACDATALPLPAQTFGFALGLNVLDCVSSPRDLLCSLAHTLQPGARIVLTCPYDWSLSATPAEAWLGGHSQRSPLAGACEAVLRALLTPGAHPASINSLKLISEREHLPWQVRLHDRSTMTYQLHLVVAERVAVPRVA